jgi:phospholipase/carboxylesterase
MSSDPHRDGPVLRFGAAPEVAVGAVILLHGRGASAQDILSLAYEFQLPQLAYFAPEAAGNVWYPNSFLAPLESNQPWVSSALNKVGAVLQLAEKAGISADRVVIGGFSQGASWRPSSWPVTRSATPA